MKYILGVGILFKKYKKKSTIKLYLDNKLIDEFDLNENILLKTMSTNDRDTSTVFGRRNSPDLPEKIRLYEIDDVDLTSSSTVRIFIDVNDTNYTNGFMTETSLICPHLIFLIPKHFLENSAEKYFKIMHKWDELISEDLKTYERYKHLHENEHILELLLVNNRSMWPCVIDSIVTYRSEKENHKNKKVPLIRWNWFGGDVILLFNIIKKHGIYMFCNNASHSVKKMIIPDYVFREFCLSKKLHKYINNED